MGRANQGHSSATGASAWAKSNREKPLAPRRLDMATSSSWPMPRPMAMTVRPTPSSPPRATMAWNALGVVARGAGLHVGGAVPGQVGDGRLDQVLPVAGGERQHGGHARAVGDDGDAIAGVELRGEPAQERPRHLARGRVGLLFPT